MQSSGWMIWFLCACGTKTTLLFSYSYNYLWLSILFHIISLMVFIRAVSWCAQYAESHWSRMHIQVPTQFWINFPEFCKTFSRHFWTFSRSNISVWPTQVKYRHYNIKSFALRISKSADYTRLGKVLHWLHLEWCSNPQKTQKVFIESAMNKSLLILDFFVIDITSAVVVRLFGPLHLALGPSC